MKNTVPILVLLLVLSLAFCDIRIVGFSLAYLPGELGAGYPRLAEVLAILSSGLFLISSIKNRIVSNRIRHGVALFLLSSLILTAFSLFKPFYSNYLRSACLIPTLLFLSVIKLRTSDNQLEVLFKIIYCILGISAFFVVISPYVDLGVSVYYLDVVDLSAQRYIGFGTSLPYQACFNLCSIPIFFFLQGRKQSKAWRVILIALLVLNIMAIILTGARTAYIIIIILFLYYLRTIIGLLRSGRILLLVIATVMAIVFFGDTLSVVLGYRHSTDLSQRDIVWLIGLQLIFSHPLFGIQNFFTEGREFGHVVAHVQNGFFEIAFWGGLFSLFFYVLSFVLFYSSFKSSDLKSCFVGMVIIFFTFMLTEILFYSVQDYLLILLIIGLLISNQQTRMHVS